MQQQLGPDDERSYLDLRDQLVERFTAWAAEQGLPVKHAGDAVELLEWKRRRDTNLFLWTVEDLDEYLRVRLPVALSLPLLLCSDAIAVAGAMMAFLGAHRLLAEDSATVTELTDRVSVIAEEALATSRDDPRVRALLAHVRGPGSTAGPDELLDRVRLLPIEVVRRIVAEATARTIGPIRMPGERAQHESAGRSLALRRFTALREFCGAGGRELTTRGWLPAGDAEPLGTDPEGLRWLVEWALAAGAVRRFKGRLVPVAAWTRTTRDPVVAVGRALDAYVGLTGPAAAGLGELLITLVTAYLHGQQVDLDLFPDGGGAHAELAGGLADCGLVVANGSLLRLSDCGVPIAVQLAEATGVFVVRLPAPEQATADELIDGLVSATPEEWGEDVRRWAADREPRLVARELVGRLGQPARPSGMVIVGLDVAGGVLGAPAVVAPVRLLLGGPHDGPAVLWLIKHNALDTSDVPRDRLARAYVDVLAALLDSVGPAGVLSSVTQKRSRAEQLSFLESLWRSDHPRTGEVLEAVSSHHRDRVVAKAARELGARHRSWQARG
ncbi:hypothetical protein [Kutzneria albida]|uniref:Uncharacterized protein n=1 Tax=Kutzneria albida DSM 43870 TaxID=1449976 RepID=W5WI33_9PSEU|nr:hypothetical protein [Kutzneria albida]AHI00854.1 hypothetical protein KALB_7496 [Kutzneria albida DSM 43870]